jgi:hypothetical protein
MKCTLCDVRATLRKGRLLNRHTCKINAVKVLDQFPYLLFLFLYVAFLQFLNPPQGDSNFYIR